MKKIFPPLHMMNTIQRTGLTVAVSILLYLGWQYFLHTPVQPEYDRLNKELTTLQKQNKHLKTWLSKKSGHLIFDQHLISPEEMSQVLQRLFHQTKGLHLISMKNMPPVVLSTMQQKTRKQKQQKRSRVSGKHPELQRLMSVKLVAHDMQMIFEGSYFSTLTYLKRIDEEKLPLLWQKMEYQTISYPRAKITLVVRSLSQKKEWLRA